MMLTRTSRPTSGHAGGQAIVVSGGSTGLAVVRALKPAGCDVHLVDPANRLPFLGTRLATCHRCPDWEVEPAAFLDWLVRFAKIHAEPSLGRTSLFVAADTALEPVWSVRNELQDAGVRLTYSFAGPPAKALDKREQARAAERAGLDHPYTYWGESASLAANSAPFTYPLIAKPAYALPRAAHVSKALLCECADDLDAALAEIQKTGAPLMLQAYIPGADDTLYMAGVFRAGDRYLAFTGHKLKQHPPTLGTSRLSEAVRVPEVVDKSVRLLEELGYEGIADIEYKRDARDGTFRFIEVNLRPWTWMGLATACGVNLALAAHRWALGEPHDDDTSPRACHVTQAAELPQRDGRWVLAQLEAADTLVGLARGVWPDWRQWRNLRAEAFFSRDDPLPFLQEMMAAARRRAPVVARRLRRKLNRDSRPVMPHDPEGTNHRSGAPSA
jgi:D-aspartate ligase